MEPIDFQKLYKEEKRKARKERRRRQKQNDLATTSADGTTTAASAAAGGVAVEGKSPSQQQRSSAATTLTALPEWTFRNDAAQRLIETIPRLHRSNNKPHHHHHRLSDTGIFYMERYFAADDDCNYRDALWDWLSRLPVNDNPQTAPHGAWTDLPHARRRVALFRAGDDNDKETSSFPPPLQILVDCLVASKVFDDDLHKPNHILVNRYTAPQGILAHTDGPRYHDRTATLSLGRGGVLLNFTATTADDDDDDNHHHHHDPQQVLLHGGGSLVVFEGAAYSRYRHSIAELNQEVEHAGDHCRNAAPGTAVMRDERISITVVVA